MVSDDRGQMVLVGAVVIAVMILGLVMVSNSALYTENIDEGGAAESGREGAAFASEAGASVQSLIIRVNHARPYPGKPTLAASVERNVSTYSDALAETHVDSRSTYVNVSVDPGASEWGRRVLQDEDAPFAEPGTGDPDWTATNAPAEVGWLVVNLNVSDLSAGSPLGIRLTNTTGSYYEASFRRDASGRVVVQTNFSDAPAANGTTRCSPTRGRLLVDLMDGEVFGRDCSFNATGHLGPPRKYEVAFDGGDNAEGRYELVVSDNASLDPKILPSHAAAATCDARECSMPAMWEANVTAVYDSPRVAYERTWDLEVYNRSYDT